MTFFWLNFITASRIFVCFPLWLWCWWKRPRGMVAWMTLDFAYFLITDHYDGQWAREYGLVSELGFWLDHSGDLLFYGAVVLSIIVGSREPAAKKPSGQRAREAAAGAASGASAEAMPPPPPPSAPPTPPLDCPPGFTPNP